MSKQEILYSDGASRYLLSGPTDWQGQILDTEYGMLFSPASLQSLLNKTDWQPYEGNQSILADLLKNIKKQ